MTAHGRQPGQTAGVLLAGGAGRRIGGPKALRRDPDGTAWVVRAARALSEGGCDPVVVVLGAQADSAASLLAGSPVRTVVADRWSLGMGESLRCGLEALAGSEPQAVGMAIVTLVDLPDVDQNVVARVRTAAGADPAALVRATYGGRPGHPVAIGRAHWAALIRQLHGDEGARGYLTEHRAATIECGDLAGGEDIDELPT